MPTIAHTALTALTLTALALTALTLTACDTPDAPNEPPPAAADVPAAEADARPTTPPPGRIQAAPILERPVVVGGISAEAVDAGVAAQQAAIDRCYTDAQAEAPGLSGKVLVNFTITGTGAVGRVATKSTSLRHPSAEACLNEQLALARFPALETGDIAYVTYPFDFTTTTH